MTHRAAHAPKWRTYWVGGRRMRACRLCPSYVEEYRDGKWAEKK